MTERLENSHDVDESNDDVDVADNGGPEPSGDRNHDALSVLRIMEESNRKGAEPALRELGGLEIAMGEERPGEKEKVEPRKEKAAPDADVLNLHGDPGHFQTLLKEKRRETDIAAFATKEKPVVFIGEEHTDAASQAFLTGQAAKLKAGGITHFGIELQSVHQPVFDKYAAGDKEARAEVEKILAGGDKLHPGIGKRYMAMVDAMVEQGLKPVVFDRFHDRPLSEDGYVDRNKHAAEIIAGIIKNNPDARIVALGGSNHSGTFGIGGMSLEKALKENHGIDSTVLHLAGGDQRQRYRGMEQGLQNSERPGEVVSRFAKAMHIEKSFTIRVDAAKGSADYLLFVPQQTEGLVVPPPRPLPVEK